MVWYGMSNNIDNKIIYNMGQGRGGWVGGILEILIDLLIFQC